MSIILKSSKVITNGSLVLANANELPTFPPTWLGNTWTKRRYPILTKGPSGSWDSLGLRDPNIMINNNGYLQLDNGKLIMYYSGYKSASPHYERAIGIATSTNGIDWTKYGSNPVLQKGTTGAWDDFGVQYANVIKRAATDYLMVYSGVNTAWSNTDSWGIGIATSTDGLSWTKYGSNPVLQSSDFVGITGNYIVTFPYIIQLLSGTYVMALCGTFGSGDVFRIYGATSSNGTTWTSLNSGNPILSPSGTGWDTDNIEGPRLYELATNQYLMSYHGDPGSTNDGVEKICIAYSTDLISWSRYTGNPILSPTTGSWDEFRVENGVLSKNDFYTNIVRMWYSGAPTGDGESNSAIGYVTGE